MYEHELSFAHGLAERAGDIGMGLFLGDGLEIRRKADRTVVTQADTSIEAMVREQVAAAFPDDHVLGEEEGGGDRAEGRVWIVDPIDATANYARGIPIWATLHRPAGRRPARAGSRERARDRRTLLGGARRRRPHERPPGARERGGPSRPRPSSSTPGSRRGPTTTAGGGRPSVLATAPRTRGFGDFWGHTLVARGAGEAMIEPELNIWDYAALQVVVEEAGGRVTQIDGSPTRHLGSAVSSNGVLHDEILSALAG